MHFDLSFFLLCSSSLSTTRSAPLGSSSRWHPIIYTRGIRALLAFDLLSGITTLNSLMIGIRTAQYGCYQKFSQSTRFLQLIRCALCNYGYDCTTKALFLWFSVRFASLRRCCLTCTKTSWGIAITFLALLRLVCMACLQEKRP